MTRTVNLKSVMDQKCADKKCQATKYYKETDKNHQTNVIMWPVKPQMDVWLRKPTMSNKKQKTCEYDNSISQPTMKKCYVFSDQGNRHAVTQTCNWKNM